MRREECGRSGLGMGRLIAVHGIRGFKAHGSVHCRQFAYRVLFYFDKWHIVIGVSVHGEHGHH